MKRKSDWRGKGLEQDEKETKRFSGIMPLFYNISHSFIQYHTFFHPSSFGEAFSLAE